MKRKYAIAMQEYSLALHTKYPGCSTGNSIVAAMILREQGYFLMLHDGNIVFGIITVILIFYTNWFCKQGSYLMNQIYWESLC